MKKPLSSAKHTVLGEAHNIVYGAEQEKVRKYGPPSESFGKMADILTILTGRQWTAEEVLLVQVVQKQVRESYSHKRDNIVDACGYLSMLNDVKHEKATKQGKDAKRSKATNSKRK